MLAASLRYLVPLLAVQVLTFSQTPTPPRGLIPQTEYSISGPPLAAVPEWSGGLLVNCDFCRSRSPILWTVDRQGKREEHVFELSGASHVSVDSIASGPDGALAVVGNSTSADDRLATFVAWISPDRKRQLVTQVWPYCPYKVTIAPDGTIWTVGPEKKRNTTETIRPNVLRHYEPSGRLLASTGVTTRQLHGVAEVSDASLLMASADRVGWLTTTCQYIEFSFTANEIGRYNCPAGITDIWGIEGIGLSRENDVVIGSRTVFKPLMLHRASHSWTRIPVPADVAGRWHRVLGFDGNSLVTLTGRDDKVRWFAWGEDSHAFGDR